MQKVRITSIPPGAAPEEIKKDWIGVVIPLSEFQPPSDEVLIRDTKDIGGDEVPREQVSGGFVVDTIDAIEALDNAGKKKAAIYWTGKSRHQILNL